MAIPRRKLNEIITRYKLEPNLDDIYVEGRSDKRIIEKSLKELNISRPVYEIDTVDITDEVLQKYGMSRGEKQEVIALSCELNLEQDSQIRMLVDRDMDDHFDAIVHRRGLVYTEHCDLEGVFLSKNLVYELICDAGGVNCQDWDSTFDSIEKVVKLIFSLKIVLKDLGYNQAFPPLSKSLIKVGQDVSLDISSLIIRVNFFAIPKAELEQRIREKFENFAQCEARMAGRGHDYLEIIGWFIKKMNGNKGIAESLDSLLVLLAPRFAENIINRLS